MSLPDNQLDEPAWEVCEVHDRFKPCYLCQLEAAEYRMECLREDGE